MKIVKKIPKILFPLQIIKFKKKKPFWIFHPDPLKKLKIPPLK